VSCTKGTNIKLLTKFFKRLSNPDGGGYESVESVGVEGKEGDEDVDVKTEMEIDGIYSVVGVGTCVSGKLLKGTIDVNQQMYLGPFKDGGFRPVLIKGIHMKRTSVEHVGAGKMCCVAIKPKSKKQPISKEEIRKGMVLLDTMSIQPVEAFIAEIVVLHHPTTIKDGYESVVHVGSVRQTARMKIEDPDKALRTGDKDRILFEFTSHPEWIRAGYSVVFRDGTTKGVGRIVQVIRREVKP